jgi:hypothetical protein
MEGLLTSNWILAALLALASVLAFLAAEPVIGVVAGGLAAMAATASVREGSDG